MPVNGPAGSNDPPWNHYKLDTGGAASAAVSIDYHTKTVDIPNQQFSQTASPVFFNIRRADLNADTKARVVWMDCFDDGAPCEGPILNQQADLKCEDGHCWAELQDTQLVSEFPDDGANFRQEFAVVVNGDWLNGNKNFQINLKKPTSTDP